MCLRYHPDGSLGWRLATTMELVVLALFLGWGATVCCRSERFCECSGVGSDGCNDILTGWNRPPSFEKSNCRRLGLWLWWSSTVLCFGKTTKFSLKDKDGPHGVNLHRMYVREYFLLPLHIVYIVGEYRGPTRKIYKHTFPTLLIDLPRWRYCALDNMPPTISRSPAFFFDIEMKTLPCLIYFSNLS